MTPGKQSSEYGLTKNVSTAGAAGLLIALITALMQEGGLQAMTLTWPLALVLSIMILALAGVVVSYNISRGLAKNEIRPQVPKDEA